MKNIKTIFLTLKQSRDIDNTKSLVSFFASPVDTQRLKVLLQILSLQEESKTELEKLSFGKISEF